MSFDGRKVYDAKTFGAKGDGSNDDTSAIQSAINAASTAGGGIVALQKGTYSTTAPLTLPSYVELRGTGEQTIVRPSLSVGGGAGHAVIEIVGTSGLITAASVKDLVIDVQANLRSGSFAWPYQIMISNAQYCAVERVVFRAHGYSGASPSDPPLLMISRDFITDITTYTVTATDLVVDGTLNTKVTSVSHSFVSGDVGKYVRIYPTAGWTEGAYTISSVSSGAAILNVSPAATGTTGGSYSFAGSGITPYPTALVGPCQYNRIKDCRFEGENTTSYFGIRMLSDWPSSGVANLGRDPLNFVNHTQGNVIDGCIFTSGNPNGYSPTFTNSPWGWNVIEHAGGGTRNNTVSNCRFVGVFCTLTCIDFDKGCNYNTAIANHIEGAIKTPELLTDSNAGFSCIDDHGIPATDPSGPYLSEGNRTIGNTIGKIDCNPASTNVLECAIGIASSNRAYVAGNTISSVNETLNIGNGINFSDCEGATITGNNIKGCNIGIRSDGSATSRHNMGITNNDIESRQYCITLPGTTGGSGNAPKNVVISGNRCTMTGVTALPCITVSGEVLAPVVANNTCTGGESGVLNGTTGTVIVGNSFRDHSACCVRMGATGCNGLVSGNNNQNVVNFMLYSGVINSNSGCFIAGNRANLVRTKTANWGQGLAEELTDCDCTSGPITITLADARILPALSRSVCKIDSSSNAISIATASGTGQTINGVDYSGGVLLALPATQYGVWTFKSDGANWTTENKYLQITNNLSELTGSAATVRTNIGLGTAATHATGDFLQTANNLSELTGSAATVRTNIGLGDASTHAASDFAQVAAANTFTHAQTIQANTGEVTTIQAASSQDTLDLKDSSGTLRSAFDANCYGFPRTLTFSLSITPQGGVAVPLTTGTDVSGWLPISFTGKIVYAQACAKTGPVGAALILDILKSTDNGSTFTSIWNSTPANRIQIADGSKTGSQSSFDTTAVSRGDLLRIDIAQVGSTTPGNDVVVSLAVLTRNQG